MKPAAIVFNPLAGKRRSEALITRLVAELARSGFDALPVPTRGPGDAEHRSREAASSGARTIFALGGDGTLRECAAGILDLDATLAFLPTGTMNVMALELGLPGKPIAAARAFARARERPFGVGLAGGTPFLMQASAGVDAFLIGSLRSREKKWLGRAATVPAVLRSLVRYRFPSFEVETSVGKRRTTLAVASNIVRYGGPFELTPEARSDGRTLELFLHTRGSRAAAMRFGLSLLVGRHLSLPGSSLTRVQKAVMLVGPDVPVQVDGDVLAVEDGRLEIGLVAKPIRLLVPRGR